MEWGLFFGAVGEVAGVAEAGYYVGVGVDFGIDGAYPQSGTVGREGAGYIVDGGLRGDYRGHMHMGRGAFG